MRLWSLHPKYLDPKGLVALWREGLLAQAVLQGQTKGYLRHPQLLRFRSHADPAMAIGSYLWAVHAEATVRGYAFDASKLPEKQPCEGLPVHQGQLEFEWKHLLSKLAIRHPERYHLFRDLHSPDCHPFFRVIPGAVEDWERDPKA